MLLGDAYQLLTLAQSKRRDGDLDEARAISQIVAEGLVALPPSRAQMLLLSGAHLELTLISAMTKDFPRTAIFAGIADQWAARSCDLSCRTQTQKYLAIAAFETGRPFAAEIHGYISAAIAAHGKTPSHEATALMYAARARESRGAEPDVDLYRRGLDAAIRAGEHVVEFEAHRALVTALVSAGLFEEARRISAEAARRWSRCGQAAAAVEHAVWLESVLSNPEGLVDWGIEEVSARRRDVGRALFKQAVRLSEMRGDAQRANYFSGYVAALENPVFFWAAAVSHLEAGLLDMAVRLHEAGAATCDALREVPLSLAAVVGMAALGAEERGDRPLATRILDDCLARVCEHGSYDRPHELIALGDQARRLGALDGAATAYSEARAASLVAGDQTTLYDATERLFDLRDRPHDDQRALGEELVAAARSLGVRETVGSLARLGQHLMADDPAAATRLLEQARDLMIVDPSEDFGSTRAGVFVALAQLAPDDDVADRLLGEAAAGSAADIPLLLESIDSVRQGGSDTPDGLPPVIVEIARLNEAARWEEALELLSRVDAGSAPLRSILLLQRAEAEYALGALAKAERSFEEAASLYKTLGADELRVVCLRALSELTRQAGRFDDTRRYVDEALALARGLGDPGVLAHCLDEAGMLAYKLDDVDEADRRFAEALAALEGREFSEVEGWVRVHIASLALDCGDYDAALAGYERVASAVADKASPELAGAIFQGISHCYVALQKPDRALHYAREASAAHTKTGRFREIALALQYEAWLLVTSGDLGGARALLHRAIADYRRIGDRPLEVDALIELALVHDRSGDHQSARSVAESAIEVAQRSGQRLTEARARQTLGQLLGADEGDRARAEIARARALLEQASAPLGVASAAIAASEVEFLADDLHGALAFAMEAVRVLEPLRLGQRNSATRGDVFAAHKDIYRWALHVATLTGDGRAALEVAEMARGDAVASLLRRGAQVLPDSAARIISEINLREGARTSTKEVAISSDEVAPLAALYEKLEQELGSSEFMGAFVPPVPDVDDLLDLVATAGAHVLILHADAVEEGTSEVHRVWVRPDREVHAPLSIELLPQAEMALDALASGETERALRAVRDGSALAGLAALIPPELGRLLKNADPDDPLTLVVIPSGRLWAVPYAALPLPGGGIVNDYACVSLVPSLELLRHKPEIRGEGTLGYWLPDLEGGVEERLTLRRVSRLSRAPTPGELFERLRHDRYLLGVLGAHGDAEPGLAQGVVLDREKQVRLTAASLFELDVPILLVLGSCWSGRLVADRSQEPLGLAVVAMARGADGVVAGLHELPSLPTARVLTRAYEEIFERGRSLARALREAQRSYRRASGTTDPSVWANLVAFRGLQKLAS